MKIFIRKILALIKLALATCLLFSTSPLLASTFYFYSGPNFQTSSGLTAPRITALFEFSDAIPFGTTILLTNSTFLGSWISAGNYGISHTVNPSAHGSNEYLTLDAAGQVVNWKFRDVVYNQGLAIAANSERSSTVVQDIFSVQPLSSPSFTAYGSVSNGVGQWIVSTSPVPEPNASLFWLTSALFFSAKLLRKSANRIRVPKNARAYLAGAA